jgi:MFS family permease
MSNLKLNISSNEPQYEEFQPKPSPLLPWIIWSCAGLFYFYEMVLRASTGVMVNELMRDFSVVSTSLGVLNSFYYYAYVPLQIPCGVIVDRLGTRKVITFSTLLCVSGSFLFALSDSLFFAQIGRFLVGAGSACAFLSCLKIGSEWFLPAQFALVAGLTNMMGTLGGMVSGPPFALLMNAYGWRQATFIFAMGGLGLAFMCWTLIKERPLLRSSSSSLPLFEGLRAVIRVPQNWIIGIVGGLMYVPVSAFCELWAIPYLMEKYQLSNHMASVASVMVYVGIAVGSPLAAKLSDLWKSRIKVIALSSILTAGLFLITLYASGLPFWSILMLLFLIGIINSGQILCFAAIKETLPNALSGTAIGFTNALVMMSGVIFQPVLGAILDFGWKGVETAEGTRLYDTDAYHMAILAIPACLILSWLLIRFVKETYKSAHIID